ncbi:MAG: Hpt domain-containing protein [Desulfovibrio sp.]|nr:Hpt domain-containing protein [Desulfovibrio sp.]
MDDAQKNALKDGGINYEVALNNFMNNETMLKKFLGKYTSEKSFPALQKAMAENDHEAALMAAHTHKSVSGTLGCQKMNQLLAEQEAAMRADDWAKASALMPEIESEYEKIRAAIKAAGV